MPVRRSFSDRLRYYIYCLVRLSYSGGARQGFLIAVSASALFHRCCRWQSKHSISQLAARSGALPLMINRGRAIQPS